MEAKTGSALVLPTHLQHLAQVSIFGDGALAFEAP
jgi:hypothetical protein